MKVFEGHPGCGLPRPARRQQHHQRLLDLLRLLRRARSQGQPLRQALQEQTPAQANVGLFPNWSWAWPVNRRVIYNRASVDQTGKPYAPKKAVLAWDATGKKWDIDVVDGGGAPRRHPSVHHAARRHGRVLRPRPERRSLPPEYYEP